MEHLSKAGWGFRPKRLFRPSISDLSQRDESPFAFQVPGMRQAPDPLIHAAIRAAHHFQFVANGRMRGTNSAAAFKRDAQALADALAEMGFVAQVNSQVLSEAA